MTPVQVGDSRVVGDRTLYATPGPTGVGESWCMGCALRGDDDLQVCQREYLASACRTKNINIVWKDAAGFAEWRLL